jgi:hypothetical protein
LDICIGRIEASWIKYVVLTRGRGSYKTVTAAGSGVISMLAPANFPFLKDFCKNVKGCKSDLPCNFQSTGQQTSASFALYAVSAVVAMALGGTIPSRNWFL